MLDVAAVALAWARSGLGTARSRRLLEPSPSQRISPEQLAFFVAIHDLGKISPGFQAKVPALCLGLSADLSFLPGTETIHGKAGMDAVADLLIDAGVAAETADRIAAATCAHHGSFPASGPVHAGTGRWPALRARAFTRLMDALGAHSLPEMPFVSDGFLLAFAGFVSVCDWAGSNTDFFPYDPQRRGSAEYLALALQRANTALDSLHLRSWSPGAPLPFNALFPTIVATALQTRCVELADQGEPVLMIVEAPTGVGKTEASLAAADRLISNQGLAGFFYGLPTQATSNQMFGRVHDFLDRRYPGQRTNLHLAHGLAHLNEVQKRLVLRAIYDDMKDGAVVADGWFRGRKRTLLAPFAVGTVDQAMLAALSVRHFFVRMFGLCGKVVVIDEVHAYDAFMSTILDRLLMWCRELGSSVILLSATLPRERREALLAAWGSPSTEEVAYPRIGIAVGETATWHALPPGEDRPVRLRHLANEGATVNAWLTSALSEGGCAAWVCNTVRAAQQAFAFLLKNGWAREELTLFHARFVVDDRQRLEQEVLGKFSRDGARPRRHIVIATQVIEQSLDLDFDVMVTEIAPVDLVLQRAGRLHRHSGRVRPGPCARPVLGWVASAASEVPDFGSSAYVYDEHVLLRSWLALHRREQLVVPSDSDRLLSEVYDPAEAPTDMSVPMRAHWDNTAIELVATLDRARRLPVYSMVTAPGTVDGFRPSATTLIDPDESPDRPSVLQARTRDIEGTATIVCLHDSGDGAYRLHAGGIPIDLDAAPDPTDERGLLGRAVTVQSPAWVRRLARIAIPTGWQKTGSLQSCHPVRFDAGGRADVDGTPLFLHPDLGLVLRAEDLEPS